MKKSNSIPLLFLITGLFFALDLLLGGSSGLAAFREEGLVIGIRLPRALTALLCGAALSLGGLQMQSIFRNPLADPHIMGVSAGAGLGAALATMAGIGSGIIFPAFAGALVCSLLVLAVASRTSSSSTLLMFGVMLGFAVNAIVAILQFSTAAEQLKLFYSWSAGSFSNMGFTGIYILAAVLAAALLTASVNAHGMDLILFGDGFASFCGARPGRIKFLALLSSSLLAAAVTSYCGPIGFIGIAGPHLARLLCRSSSHRRTIPCSLLCGAAVSCAADLLSQIWGTPLPVGSVMAIIGIPVVMAILLGSRPLPREQ